MTFASNEWDVHQKQKWGQILKFCPKAALRLQRAALSSEVDTVTRAIHFKSEKDDREFVIKVPESPEDIENNDFIEIDCKTRIVEDVFFYDP